MVQKSVVVISARFPERYFLLMSQPFTLQREVGMAKLSYDGIQKQIARLQAQAKALENAEGQKKARAVERVRALMKRLGVEVSDLTAAPAAKRTARAKAPAKAAKGARKSAKAPSTVAPKFRDPATGVTWSGRGRTPVWLSAYLDQGRTREEFAIAAAAQPAQAPTAQ